MMEFSHTEDSHQSDIGLVLLNDDINAAEDVNTSDSSPDGGMKAWLVVFGAFCLNFATFGPQTSVGLFQIYWQSHQLSDFTLAQISWIPAIFIFLSLALSIQFGLFFDRYGARVILIPSCIAYSASLFALAHCTRYWHFILTLSLVAGISSAAIVTVSLGVISHWFSARKGLANGIVTCGSSVGGIAFSLILRSTLPGMGWQKSMYISGACVSLCCAVGVLTVKERSRSKNASLNIMDFSAFWDFRFVTLSLSVFGFELLLITGLGVIPAYAIDVGFSIIDGYYLITALNIGSVFGRLGPAYLSDRYGHMNGLIIMASFTLVSMCAFWAPFGQKSLIALYIAVVFFGFGTGSFVSISPACVSQLCSPAAYGKWIGALYTLVSVATLISLPIGSTLQSTYGPQVSVYFLIGILAASIVACLVSRLAYQKWHWVWLSRV